MNDHTICARDVQRICGLTGYAVRNLLNDPALSKKFFKVRGPKGGNGRRFWTLRAILPVLRQQPYFTPAMECRLASLDLQRRIMEIEYV